jgi:hypothetical protein
VAYAPDDVWKFHPKHVEQFPDINKMCNVASCWMYVEILLGAHPILHISRIRVNYVFSGGRGKVQIMQCVWSFGKKREKMKEM